MEYFSISEKYPNDNKVSLDASYLPRYLHRMTVLIKNFEHPIIESLEAKNWLIARAVSK